MEYSPPNVLFHFPFFLTKFQNFLNKFQEMSSSKRIPFFIVLILFSLSRIFPIDSAYIKSRCGFQSQNYTIKWAFEPQTQNVVFVLKAKLPEEEFNLKSDGDKQLITGIGFGNEDQLDFIGIMSINDQLDLVSGHLEGAVQNGNNNNGNKKGKGFKVSPVANGKGEGANGIRSISLKKRNADGSVIAEFARPLNGGEDHKMADLSGCTNFFLVTKWIEYENGAEKNELPMSATVRRNVCALAEKCSLDIREVNGQNVKEEGNKKVDSTITKNTQRDNGIGNSETPELGESVDISGKGDPCSFSGTNYALRWTYDKATDSVEFIMKQKPKKGKWWSAVGIGDNMSDMDIGIIFLDDGTPKEMSDYFSTSYDVPDKDMNQDWKLDKKESKWNENEVEMHFSRKLITDDEEKDRTLDGCVLFQFAANAGRYGPGNRIYKHEDWPDLYKACDLKKRCIRQKRQKDNLPVISHSTDDKNGGNQQSKATNQQIEGGPNSSGDKVINLLMKSLGPQIVKTVSESEAANSDYKNTTIVPFGVKESATGSATIFSIIEDGAEEGGNYTQNGKENGQKELAESEERNSEEENRGKPELKPIGEKRQELNEVEANTNPNAETTSSAPISSTSAGEEGSSTLEETYSSPTASSIANSIQNNAIPVAAPQPNTGSPFSLNAFLGGEQTNPENLVPVGEAGPNRTSERPNVGGEIGQSTSIVRISGEATSAENVETTPAGGNGFGINQMFGSEGSTNSGREEAVESTNDGKTTNATTSNWPSELSSTVAPIGENEPTPTSSAEEEGHPAEEGPQMIGGNTQIPPLNNSLPPIISSSGNSPAQPFSTNPTESNTNEVDTEAENAATTYVVPNITSTPEGNESTASTGGFELIASVGEEDNATSTILTAQTTLQTSSPIPSSTSITSSISSSNTASPSNGTGNDENEIYSTPTTKSTPESTSPTVTSSISPSTSANAVTQNRMTIEGDGPTSNSNGLEDGENNKIELPTSQTAGNNQSSENVGIGGNNGNTLEKPNGLISPQTSDNGSGDLEERGIKLPVATTKCDALRPDLPICQSYMGAYLERVKDWAERHGEPMNNQFPKACKLLSAVPHVPTLCCQIFAEKCADYI